jgi:flagellum-specific ATP synthase
VDAARSLLDGHVILSRAIAAEGHYPPIAVLDSVSRLASSVTTPEHRQHAVRVRRLLAAYTRSEDLVRIGAYRPGTDAELDQALRAMPAIRRFLAQNAEERVGFADCLKLLEAAGKGA